MSKGVNILLTVSDISKSVDYYRTKLGFHKNTELKDGNKVRYVDFTWGPNVLMLVPQEYKESVSGIELGIGVEIYIDIDEDIHMLTERLKKLGVVFAKELYTTPWNTYQFHLTDPDGYKLVFSQKISKGGL